MSNPLLRPNDPRFQRPPMHDAEGKNLFADPDAPIAAEPADGGPVAARPADQSADNVFAAPSAHDDVKPAYQPQYETIHQHRGILLLVLAVVGLAGDGALLLVFTAAGAIGLIGLLSIVPAGIAFLLGRADLQAMRQGSMEPSGMPQTRLAMWLGLAGVVLYAGALAAVIVLFVLFILPLIQNG